jgi:hypothetical protein
MLTATTDSASGERMAAFAGGSVIGQLGVEVDIYRSGDVTLDVFDLAG